MPDTKYRLVFNNLAANPSKPALTASDDEDPDGLEGWTIGDVSVRPARERPLSERAQRADSQAVGEATSTDARILGLTV